MITLILSLILMATIVAVCILLLLGVVAVRTALCVLVSIAVTYIFYYFVVRLFLLEWTGNSVTKSCQKSIFCQFCFDIIGELLNFGVQKWQKLKNFWQMATFWHRMKFTKSADFQGFFRDDFCFCVKCQFFFIYF